jgi:hypothetical protein
MNTTTKVNIEVIRDHEGDGRCGVCGREGLRWVAYLSDGRQVGMECAKPIIGFRPTPKSYQWVADFEEIASYSECGSTCTLYRHKRRAQTAWARDGFLVAVGGAEQDWKEWGWVAA